MLQTIDRALTLLVDMEEVEGQAEFLQAQSKSQLETISTTCTGIIEDAVTENSNGSRIEDILQTAIAELDVLQKRNTGLIIKRLYFISAIIYIIIMRINGGGSNFDVVKQLTLDGGRSGLLELTTDEVTMINPYIQPKAYVQNAIYGSVDHKIFSDKSSCTIS
jgi:hypothetical protein